MPDATCRAGTEITLLSKFGNGDIVLSVGSDCIVKPAYSVTSVKWWRVMYGQDEQEFYMTLDEALVAILEKYGAVDNGPPIPDPNDLTTRSEKIFVFAIERCLDASRAIKSCKRRLAARKEAAP